MVYAFYTKIIKGDPLRSEPPSVISFQLRAEHDQRC